MNISNISLADLRGNLLTIWELALKSWKALHRGCGWKSKVHFILISFLRDSCSSLEHILLKLCQIIYRSKSVKVAISSHI